MQEGAIYPRSICNILGSSKHFTFSKKNTLCCILDELLRFTVFYRHLHCCLTKLLNKDRIKMESPKKVWLKNFIKGGKLSLIISEDLFSMGASGMCFKEK